MNWLTLHYRMREFLFAFFVSLSLGHGSLSALADDFLSVEEFKVELRSKNMDRILEAANTIRGMGYQGQILPFVRDLWEGRKSEHPELPWDIIETDVVRLSLAGVLSQAYANGLIDFDLRPLRQFLLRLAESSDRLLARRAISNLALIDDQRDVEALLAIAKTQDESTFKAAVSALAEMCNGEAETALDRLEQDVTEPDATSLIKDTRREWADYKALTLYCEFR